MSFWSPKNGGENFSIGYLHSEFFGAGWAAIPPLHWLLLCLRVIVTWPGFVHSHKSRQEIIWIAPKKSQKLIRRPAPLTFLIRVQVFRDPLGGELPHVQIFMNDGPDPLTWDAQLLSYWFSRNPAVFQDWLVNLINNLWGGHCFGSSRTRRVTGGRVTTFKVGHPVFDGGIQWCMYP